MLEIVGVRHLAWLIIVATIHQLKIERIRFSIQTCTPSSSNLINSIDERAEKKRQKSSKKIWYRIDHIR